MRAVLLIVATIILYMIWYNVPQEFKRKVRTTIRNMNWGDMFTHLGITCVIGLVVAVCLSWVPLIAWHIASAVLPVQDTTWAVMTFWSWMFAWTVAAFKM